MTRKESVPVYTEDGKLLGYVSKQATSIGASKVAGCPCEYVRKFGRYAWIAKEEQQ